MILKIGLVHSILPFQVSFVGDVDIEASSSKLWQRYEGGDSGRQPQQAIFQRQLQRVTSLESQRRRLSDIVDVQASDRLLLTLSLLTIEF